MIRFCHTSTKIVLAAVIGIVGCHRSLDAPTDPPSATLTISAAAPGFTVEEWLKGPPVDQIQDGHIYVIDFWATWCQPCLKSIPHLNQLQREYEGQVTFIGVTSEAKDTVLQFLDRVQNPQTGRTWDQLIRYRLAIDGGQMQKAYMHAAGQMAIPTLFVIGPDRTIQWIGPPSSLDTPLSQIVSGTWDEAAARAQFEAQRIVTSLQRELQESIAVAGQTGDWQPVLTRIDQLRQSGADPHAMDLLQYSVFIEAGRADQVLQLVDQLADDYWQDARQLNEFAWDLVTRLPREQRDEQLSERLARRANELSDYENAGFLDTLARVKYEQGDLESAIEWQRKAVEVNTMGLNVIQQTLDRYLEEADQRTPAAGSRDGGSG